MRINNHVIRILLEEVRVAKCKIEVIERILYQFDISLEGEKIMQELKERVNEAPISTNSALNSQEIIKVNPSSVTKSDKAGIQTLDSNAHNVMTSANDTKTPDAHSQIKKEIDKDYDFADEITEEDKERAVKHFALDEKGESK